MSWKNITSYSRSDENRVPRTFEYSLDQITIVVTRHIHYPPDVWLLRAEPFANLVEISTGSAEEAQAYAIKYVKGALRHHLERLEQV